MQNQSFLNEIANQFTIGDTSISQFVINLLITIVLSLIVGMVYTKYGNSLSNRKKLQQTFVLMSVTVMIVITIVKSSLALSLGLVGALSIVRFRTAIKEPEELIYFFIAIALGLGIGANQRVITVIGVAIIVIYIVLQNIKSNKQAVQQNLIVTFSNAGDKKIQEQEIISALKGYCTTLELRRLDQAGGSVEISLHAAFKDLDSILNAKETLSKIGDLQFSFIETY